jgi:hypothetical protein
MEHKDEPGSSRERLFLFLKKYSGIKKIPTTLVEGQPGLFSKKWTF